MTGEVTGEMNGEVTSEQNWGGNVEYQADAVARPSSTDELIALVAASDGLAAIASRHSFNRIGDGRVLVDLGDLPRTVDVDDVAGTVSVPAWITYAELGSVLAARGRALHNLASLPHISIAGAISTGTHGSGSDLGSLATAVEAVELLTASGETITRRRGDADFLGSVVGLGSLGLLTRLTLGTEPTYDVEQTVYDGLDWATLTGSFDALFASATSVSVFTRWGDAPGELWRKQRVDRERADSPDVDRGLRPADGMRHPIVGGFTDACTHQLGEPGPWWNRLPHFRADAAPSAGAEIQSECFVARTDAAAAIEAMRSLGAALDEVLLVSEIRTVAADDLWMSPCYERDSVGFHFTWRLEPKAVQVAVDRVAEELAPFDLRCHLGKVMPTGWRIESPRLDDFLDLKHRIDPTDRFTTDWFRTHVGLGSSGGHLVPGHLVSGTR